MVFIVIVPDVEDLWAEEAYVNDPQRGLHLGRFTLTPSGALLPVHPYRVLIRRPVDCLRGAVRPVNVPEAPTISSALRPLPLAVASVGYEAHGIPRDSSLFRQKQAK